MTRRDDLVRLVALADERYGRLNVLVSNAGAGALSRFDNLNVDEASIMERMEQIAIPPDAIARAIVYAIEQPDEVDIGDIVVRPRCDAAPLLSGECPPIVWPLN